MTGDGRSAGGRDGRARIPAPTLVGRNAELACLLDHLDAARRSEGTVLFLIGEAGIGKSRLCRELASRTAHCVQHLQGACSPFLPDTPFGPFVDALRGYLRDLSPDATRDLLGPAARDLGPMLPELGWLSSEAPLPPADGHLRRHLLEVWLRLVCRLAERRPLLLILEDLHWADPDTLDLVRYLALGIRQRPVLLIGTFRTDEAPPGSPPADLLAELLSARVANRLDVKPLDRHATAELAGAILDLHRPAPVEFASVMHRYASGNPFFTEEAIRVLLDSGAPLDGDEGLVRRDPGSLVLPPAAQDLVAARLSHLPTSARLVLEVLAVAGRPCEIAVLARAAGLTPEAAAGVVGETYRRQFLTIATAPASGYRFRHELVQRALLDRLLPEERSALHARLAAAIEAEHASAPATWAAELAQHYWAAGRPAQAAVHAWPAALRAIAQHAYQEAVRFLVMCLASGPAGDRRAAVLEYLGDARVRTGALSEADTVYRELLAEARATGDQIGTGRTLRKLAALTHERGDPHRALALGREAVELLAAAGEPRELADSLVGLSRYMSAGGDWQGAVAAGERAVAEAEASGDSATLCTATNWLAFHLVHAGQVERAERHALRSLALAEQTGNLPALQQTYQILGSIHGDVRANHWLARRYYRRSLILARRCSDILAEIKALHNLGAWVSKPRGRFRRAEILLTRAHEIARRTDHHRAALYALVHLTELARLRGDDGAVRSHVTTLRHGAAAHGDLMIRCRIAAKIEAPLALEAGHPHEALHRLREAWCEAEAAGFAGGQVVLGPPLAEILIDLGETGEAEAVLARVQAMGPAVGDRGEEIEGLRVLARLAVARGDNGRAADLLERACRKAEELTRPFDTARVLRDQAALRAATDPGAARDLFRRALATFTAIGASAEAERTRRLARRCGVGVRLRHPGAGGQTLTRLTSRETQVAVLVARGETNRAIAAALSLTTATVEVHLRHIFDKLGLERRSQLAVWVVEQGLGAHTAETVARSGSSRGVISVLPRPVAG